MARTIDCAKSDSRTEQLKGYLRRLSAGEDMEFAREHFMKQTNNK